MSALSGRSKDVNGSTAGGVQPMPYQRAESEADFRRDKLLSSLMTMSSELSYLSKIVHPQPQTIMHMLETVQENVGEQLENNIAAIRSLSESINSTLAVFEEGLEKQAKLSDDHDGAISTVNSTLVSLKSSVDGVMSRMEVINNVLTKQTESANRYTEKINTASATMNDLVKEIKRNEVDLNARHSTSTAGLVGVVGNGQKADKAINSLLEIVRQIKTDLTVLDRLAPINNVVEEIRGAVKSNLTLKHLDSFSKTFTEQTGSLRTENVEIMQQLEQIKAIQQSLVDGFENSREKTVDLVKEVATLTAELNAAKMAVVDKETAYNTLRRETEQTIANAKADQEREIANIKSRLQHSVEMTNKQYTEACASLEKKLQEQIDVVTKLQEQEGQLKKRLEESDRQMKLLKEQEGQLKKRLEERDRQLEKLMDQNDDLTLKNQDLTDRLNSLSADNDDDDDVEEPEQEADEEPAQESDQQADEEPSDADEQTV